MEDEKCIYVQTVYYTDRLPNISIYTDEEDAESFVNICLKWGIGILSCKIIPKEQAQRGIESGNVEISTG